jgi:CheY-like chemotaxis protein
LHKKQVEILLLLNVFSQKNIIAFTKMTSSKPAENMIDLVMLVDDNDTDNFISKRIIEITKFAKRVEIKNSGKSALQYLEENQNKPENLPDLIFLDINMPIVDGFVFLFEFEMFPEELKKKCKVVILSSSDNKRDIEKIVDNEYVIKFITKPLTDNALNEVKTLLSALQA